MANGDELVARAQDYLSGTIDLRALDMWLAGHVDECDELDRAEHPASGLAGFIQVRIYEMNDGLREQDLRRDLAEYLAEHKLLETPTKQRATG